mgnify:CR=1 FL=1
MKTNVLCVLAVVLAAVSASAQPAAQGGPADPAAEQLREAQPLVRAQKFDEALAIYKRAIAEHPDSMSANIQAGTVLDYQGQYAAAKPFFAKAIELAGTTPARMAQANRAMALSYAFERDCKGATKYEVPVYEMYKAAKDAYNTGEIANELARVCLESGDLDTAAHWYEIGYAAGLAETNIAPARKDLWEFRNENALARLAARRGQRAEAEKHVALAKAVLDRGSNPEQKPFFAYLVGYVGFYLGDYQKAIAEMEGGNQNDPFVLALIAQSYDKLGNKQKSGEYWQKSLSITIHNPTGAYARPLAKKALGLQ